MQVSTPSRHHLALGLWRVVVGCWRLSRGPVYSQVTGSFFREP